jgi:hypothetical protein
MSGAFALLLVPKIWDYFQQNAEDMWMEMYISTIYTTHRIIFRYTLTTYSLQLESISLRDIAFHIFIS